MKLVRKFRSMPRVNQIGFLSPLVSPLCIAIATSILPNYDWAVNPLSDLGSWSRIDLGDLQILSAIIFNGGLIVTGLLAVYVMLYFVKRSNDAPTKIGFLIFTGTSLLLAGVGFFSEDFPLPHVLTAVPFFLSLPIGLCVVGLAWVRFSEMRTYGIMSILFSLLSILIMFQPWLDLSVAVFEILEAFVAMTWILSVNYMHYTGRLAHVFNPEDI
jgi:hypothetical membrane protein